MNDTARAILGALGPNSARLVAAFYEPSNRFAGATFDHLAPNPRDDFAASDVLAASLLDVPFRPRAVRSLLGDNTRGHCALLGAVRDDVDLWDASDDDLAPAYDLWAWVRTLDGVGPTRASKLMARKRPRLIPVVDRVVREHVPLGDDSWVSFRDALRDVILRDRIEELRPDGLSGISTLRLLDAALWMNLSESVHVSKFRA